MENVKTKSSPAEWQGSCACAMSIILNEPQYLVDDLRKQISRMRVKFRDIQMPLLHLYYRCSIIVRERTERVIYARH